MTTRYRRHVERQAELAALGRPLVRRARSACELCGTGATSLHTAEVDPLPDGTDLDRVALVCAACCAAIEGGEIEPSESHFLEVAVWSELAPVQVLAVRLARRLADAGVPCGAVFDTQEVLSHPHLVERGAITDVEHPTRGRYPMIGCPVTLSDSPVEVTHAPLYGEHSDQVFMAIGGLTRDQVDELRADKVIV